MPRSGPRPYECIRRAWHSDRHQPVRGSLIKEIFRVVNEIHSSATKKNKEWQEKLPVVVLKAEEIMYSKANSEAEYTDLKTLWDRANDAINTIIRRDEITETGAEFLQPCIEAALHLGCVARRASRSQRYSNPRCYLSPITSDVHSDSIVVEGIQRDSTSNSQHPHRCLNMKPITMNATHIGAKANFKFTSASKNVPPYSPRDTQPATKFSSYPLYYGKCPRTKEVEHGYAKSDSNPLEPTPTKIIVIPNLFASEDKSNNNAQIDTRDYAIQIPYTLGCDLSLRLGLNSSQCQSSEIHLSKQVGAQEGTKSNNLSPHLDKDLSFATGNGHAPIDSCLSPWSYKREFMNLESTSRKRKAEFIHPAEDIKLCRQPELPFMGNRGL